MSSVYFNLASGNLVQDWSDTSLLSANDDWSGVPSIVGYISAMDCRATLGATHVY